MMHEEAGMISWHRAGQKVVCIVPRPWDLPDLGFQKPIFGVQYTIREVVAVESEVGFLLNEIRNDAHQWADGFHEGAWLAACFKPVRETDISCFEAILKQVNDSVLV